MDTPDGATAFEQLQGLLGRSPDPEGDRRALILLSRRDDPEILRLARWLRADPTLRRTTLRKLLPGVDLLHPALPTRLGARATNCLSRAGIDDWRKLAGRTPSAIARVFDVGPQLLDEVLLATLAEWASAFLPEPTADLRHSGDEGAIALIGRPVDPIADREVLLELRNGDDPATSRFCANLRSPPWQHQPLRDLLLGLDLVEAPSLRDRLGFRAANSLGQIGVSDLAALAGIAPMEIRGLPRVGVGTLDEILTALTGEWAAAYLRQNEDDRGANSQPHRGAAESEHPRISLVEAFEELERLPAFPTFRRRWLEGDSVTFRAIAAELGVSAQRISQRVAAIDRVVSQRLRDPDWPIGVAVETLQVRLGSVARPAELVGAFAALDGGALSGRHPHRQAFLLRLGDYRITDEWILGPDIESLTNVVLTTLAGDGGGDIDAVCRHLARLGVREELQLPWLTSRHGFRIVAGELVAL